MFWSFLAGFLGCLVSNEHHVTHNESLLSIAGCGEPPSHDSGRKLSLHRRRTRRREIDKARRVFLLLAQLLAALGDLLLELRELLLNVGREVGYLQQPADFNHFVIRAGDARGPFERLFARLHLNNPEAADHFLRFGERAVGNFRFSAFEGDARAHRRGRGQTVEREQHAGFL
jgi:hypothetical protein